MLSISGRHIRRSRSSFQGLQGPIITKSLRFSALQPQRDLSLCKNLSRLSVSQNSLSRPTAVSSRIQRARTMTSITLDNPKIKVTLPEGLTEEQFRNFAPFKTWLKQLNESLALQEDSSHTFYSNKYQLRGIEVQSYDLFGQRVGFLKLKADVSNDAVGPKGVKSHLPGVVFLRGPSVGMLVVLTPDDIANDSPKADAERMAVLTVQPRIAAGSLEFVELPAGMSESGDFKVDALKEIEEEVGMKLKDFELSCMSDLVGTDDNKSGPHALALSSDHPEKLPQAMYPSAGGCDEYIKLFLAHSRITRDQMEKMQNKHTGLREDGEMITLKLVPLNDLYIHGIRDAKCLAAVTLFERLRRDGKLKL